LLASFTVTTTIDALDRLPGDGVCEIDGGGCSLRAAVQEVNALGDDAVPHEILIPEGLYVLTLPGTDEENAQSGDLNIRVSVNLVGDGPDETILDADGLDRVIDVVLGDVVIQGLTIRGGHVDAEDQSFENLGGGIRNQGNLTVIDSVVTGNVAASGAGIANYNGTLKLQRSTISGNGDSSTLRGGGIFSHAYYDNANLQIIDSTIADNQATMGGGIMNLATDGTANATIQRSTISGNSAMNGGGITNQGTTLAESSSLATLILQNSTVSGNTADGSGGGLDGQASYAGLTQTRIHHSTITDNTATGLDGGGVRSVDSPNNVTELLSSIVAGNVAGRTGSDLFGQSIAGMFNLIGDPAGHAFVSGSGKNQVGLDPLLGPLEENGGPTLTHMPQTGSPAIDQGTNSFALTSDQRGIQFRRTVDTLAIDDAADGTDIGAVETDQIAMGLVADLSLELLTSQENPAVGDRVVFTLTLNNAGPDQATNIEVSTSLPEGLLFVRASPSRGVYDDQAEIWELASVPAGSVATLRIEVTVQTSDSIEFSVEIIASDQEDPNSTPGNDEPDEDDQASVTLGTCLSRSPLQSGVNQLTFSCATPGGWVGFVHGIERGATSFPEYSTTVDIADAQGLAIAIADTNGIATMSFRLTDDQIVRWIDESTELLIFQAFEMFPGDMKGNTLTIDAEEVRQEIARISLGINLLDVNRDERVSALDALLVINWLGRPSLEPSTTESIWMTGASITLPIPDTNADLRVTALDALIIINQLAQLPASPIEADVADWADPLDRARRRQHPLIVGF
jgi:uncharacterized repeat protein (TIGR01451 family)